MKSSSSERRGRGSRWAGIALLGAALGAFAPGACGNEASRVEGNGGSGGGVIPDTPCGTEGEVRSCYPGSPLTANIGACHDGTSTCADGLWGACLDFQLPGDELCNGVDDDCDGQADDGCSSGGGGAGGSEPTGWRLYRRGWAGSSPFTSQALSDVWQGANAPPSTGILAADVSQEFSPGTLFVIDEAGTLYVRQGATWLLPRPVDAVFAGVDGALVNCVTMWRSTASSPQSVEIVTRTGGTDKLAYFFEVTLPSLSVTADPNNPILIPAEADPDAPPQHQADCTWMFSHQSAFLGTAHWVVFYMQYEANAYELDGGDFNWLNLGPAGQSTVWGTDPASGPAASTVTAAWLDGTDLYLVAP